MAADGIMRLYALVGERDSLKKLPPLSAFSYRRDYE